VLTLSYLAAAELGAGRRRKMQLSTREIDAPVRTRAPPIAKRATPRAAGGNSALKRGREDAPAKGTRQPTAAESRRAQHSKLSEEELKTLLSDQDAYRDAV